MYQQFYNIFNRSLPTAIQSAVVNGYFGVKEFILGKSAVDVAHSFANGTAQSTGYEVLRQGMHTAAQYVPGPAKYLAPTAADMTLASANAAYNGQSIMRTAAKTGAYALNNTLCSPLGVVAPLATIPLSAMTDYAVDQAVDNIDFAYKNYKNRNSQYNFCKGYKPEQSDYMQQRVVDNLNNSFVLVERRAAPAA